MLPQFVSAGYAVELIEVAFIFRVERSAKETLKGASRCTASLADIATPCVIVSYADVPDFMDSELTAQVGEQPNKAPEPTGIAPFIFDV